MHLLQLIVLLLQLIDLLIVYHRGVFQLALGCVGREVLLRLVRQTGLDVGHRLEACGPRVRLALDILPGIPRRVLNIVFVSILIRNGGKWVRADGCSLGLPLIFLQRLIPLPDRIERRRHLVQVRLMVRMRWQMNRLFLLLIQIFRCCSSTSIHMTLLVVLWLIGRASAKCRFNRGMHWLAGRELRA